MRSMRSVVLLLLLLFGTGCPNPQPPTEQPVGEQSKEEEPHTTENRPEPSLEPTQEPAPEDAGSPDIPDVPDVPDDAGGPKTPDEPPTPEKKEEPVPEVQPEPKDNPCLKHPSHGQPCVVGQGECRASGTFQCTLDGQTIECSVKPGTPSKEVCDGKDNDCDGETDEGCNTCTPNATRSCYEGPANTEGKGPCKAGTQTCGSDGKWGTCTGQVIPKAESCNGIDDDCNGTLDDNCPCIQGETRPCGSSKGECQQGTQACVSGMWSTTCTGEVKPTTEVCDGKDNDCNGKVDDALTAPACQKQLGACAGSVKQCAGTGGWSACTDADYTRQNPKAKAGTETDCDGVDNNCNGTVDENCSSQNTQVFHVKQSPSLKIALPAATAGPQGTWYVAGRMKGVALLGTEYILYPGQSAPDPSIQNVEDYSFVIFKFDTAGKMLWYRVPTYTGNNSEIWNITTDSQGNAYVAGVFTKTLKFGAFTLTAQKAYDIFVAKIDSNGTWKWATSGGSKTDTTLSRTPAPSSDGPTDIAVDAQGKVYLTGYFASQFYHQGSTQPTNGRTFYATISAQGAWQSVQALQGNNEHYARNIHLDGSGGFVLTGAFLGNVTFGTHVLGSTRSWSVFAAHINSQGSWTWAAKGSGSSESHTVSSRRDQSGNIYFFGAFEGTVLFDVYSLQATNPTTYLAKLDDKGKWQWAMALGPNATQSFQAFDLGPAGEINLTGVFTGTMLLGSFSITASPPGNARKSTFAATINAQGQWTRVLKGASCFKRDLYSYFTNAQGDTIEVGFIDQWNQDQASFGTNAIDFTLPGPTFFFARLPKASSWNQVVQWAPATIRSAYIYKSIPPKLDAQSVRDNAGNVYLRGPLGKYLGFNNSSKILASTGLITSAYVAKIDPNGKLLWAVATPNGFAVRERFNATALSPSGETYFFGQPTTGTLAFGTQSVDKSNCTSCNWVLAKLGSNGNWLWAKGFDTNALPQKAFVDQAGNFYWWTDSFDSGTPTVNGTPVSFPSSIKALFCKWSNSGQYQGCTFSSLSSLTLVQLEGQSDIFLGGAMRVANAAFTHGTTTLPAAAGENILYRTDTQFTAIKWSYRNTLVAPQSALTDSTGNTYVLNQIESSGATRYQSIDKINNAGTRIWQKRFGFSNIRDNLYQTILWTQGGQIALLGNFSTLHLLGTIRVSPVGFQVVMSTIDTNGTWQASQFLSTSDTIKSLHFHTGTQGEIYSSGIVLAPHTLHGVALVPYVGIDQYFTKLKP